MMVIRLLLLLPMMIIMSFTYKDNKPQVLYNNVSSLALRLYLTLSLRLPRPAASTNGRMTTTRAGPAQQGHAAVL